MKSRLIPMFAFCFCAGLLCAAQEKPTLPLPDSGNVTLPLDEYNKLVELAGKTPKKPDTAPLAYSIKHADVKLIVQDDSIRGTVQP